MWRDAENRWSAEASRDGGEIAYRYELRAADGSTLREEWGDGHLLDVGSAERVEIFDCWRERPAVTPFYSAFGPLSGCGGCRGACSVARRGACRSVGRDCGGRRRACGLGRLAVGSRDRDERRRGSRVERVAARGCGGHGVQIRRARLRDEASEAIRRRVQPSLSVGRGAQRGDNRRAAKLLYGVARAWLCLCFRCAARVIGVAANSAICGF